MELEAKLKKWNDNWDFNSATERPGFCEFSKKKEKSKVFGANLEIWRIF